MLDIRACEESSEGLEDVAKFLRSIFLKASYLDNRYLEWNYFENPDGRAIALNAYVDNEIIGHLAAIPLRARLFNQEEKGLLITHVGAKQNFKGRGISSMLSQLLNKTIEVATDYNFLICVANDQSIRFHQRLDFDYVHMLDAKLGLGSSARGDDLVDVDFERLWSPEAVQWRLSRPNCLYRIRTRDDVTLIYADSGRLGIQVELGMFPRSQVHMELPILRTVNPIRLWIGLDPTRRWQGRPYVNIPKYLLPSPLHFIIQDLNERGRRLHPQRVRFSALDFDAY